MGKVFQFFSVLAIIIGSWLVRVIGIYCGKKDERDWHSKSSWCYCGWHSRNRFIKIFPTCITWFSDIHSVNLVWHDPLASEFCLPDHHWMVGLALTAGLIFMITVLWSAFIRSVLPCRIRCIHFGTSRKFLSKQSLLFSLGLLTKC